LGLSECPGGNGCRKTAILERDPTENSAVIEGEPLIPGVYRETAKVGYHKEVYANKPIRPQDATNKWEEFLGEGPYTNKHPRTNVPDPDRLVSSDGLRSIRYGTHEMGSNPSKHHYHEEKWIIELKTNVMNVENTVVRVPLPKKKE
jgi:hypothetical protein